MTTIEHDWQLVEDGYQRTWHTEIRDGEIVATFRGLEDFSEDGDGNLRLQCRDCLKIKPLPDDVEITWN